MKFFDYLRTAFKNLSRSKSRTILTIIAITVGSFSLIFMASIIISIRASLNDQFQKLGAFDLVTVIKDPNSTDNNALIGGSNGDPSEGKKIDESTLTAMRKLAHVKEATPTLNNFNISNIKLEGQDRKTWASLLAYDPANDVFNISIAHGRKLETGDLDKIVIGQRFIDDMKYSGDPASLLGKHVILMYRSGPNMAPDWGALPAKPDINQNQGPDQQNTQQTLDIPVEIVGITASGPLDDGQSYITLDFARRLMTNVSWQFPQQKQEQCQPNKPCNSVQPQLQLTKDDNFIRQGYSSIILKADSTSNVTAIANEVKALGYGANTAQAMLDQINQILFIMSIVLAVIGGISLFVATIGIVNTMVMATYERIREIGVMRACGATRAAIRRLFLVESALLGFWGGVCGLLVSLGLAQVARYIVQVKGASLGQLPVDHLGDFPIWLVVAVIAFTTLLGMLSGLIPSIRAARMDPVEALRYE